MKEKIIIVFLTVALIASMAVIFTQTDYARGKIKIEKDELYKEKTNSSKWIKVSPLPECATTEIDGIKLTIFSNKVFECRDANGYIEVRKAGK